MKRHNSILGALALAAVLSGGMLAQKTSGTVTGQVTDPSGAAVPNATVTLVNKATATNRTVHTNGSGEYTFTDVAIGTYEIDVTAASFRKQVTQGGQFGAWTRRHSCRTGRSAPSACTLWRRCPLQHMPSAPTCSTSPSRRVRLASTLDCPVVLLSV